jgi:hypothetical protein
VKTNDRRRAQDFVDLMAAANRAISIALADGDRPLAEPQAERAKESATCAVKKPKHPAGSWMSENIAEQLKHIESHITAELCGDHAEDHLAHIVCRAAIAFALKSWKPPSPRLSSKTAGEEQKGDLA